MRLFQNVGLSAAFRRYAARRRACRTFAEYIAQFLNTRYGAPHILGPVLEGHTSAFLANGDDAFSQQIWAREHSVATTDLETILLAQIEHHRTEVFYNLDPIRFGSAFVLKLPGCVRKAVCWRAAPSGQADLSHYDLVVCNFPTILEYWERQGCKVAYFFPAHDPVMDGYAASRTSALDLVFVGGFSRHHRRRVAVLDAAAKVTGARARFYLEDSRLTRIANFLPFLPGLGTLRHPPSIRAVREGPVYGRELYTALSKARIALNGAVDMAGNDRGNMRCFEALGCGALLLTDAGNYPKGFVDGETMVTYSDAEQVPELLEQLLDDADYVSSVAQRGHDMVRKLYSKQRQWSEFQVLI